MATPSIVRRLGDKAKSYSPFPDNTDFEGLKAVQSNVDAVSGKKPEKAPEPSHEVYPQDTITPKRQYGDRPGEKVYSDQEMKEMTHPLGSLPVYDEGGDVDVNDGKHQLAVLQDGEKVLTPEEAQAYNEQGAPAEFNGRVLPNPDHIKPQNSEEAPEGMRLPKGAKLSTDLAPMEAPKGDISNATGNEVETEAHETSAVQPGESIKKPGAEEAPSMSSVMSGQKPRLDPNSMVGKILQQDKEKAAATGDLVGLGTAVLSENHLAPNMDAGHEAGELSHQAKLQDYDKQIQAAMDKSAQSNDPAFAEQADRLRLAKAQYEKNTPWGSPDNHPGVLGRIGHIASRIGNVAGDLVAPHLMEDIPGTELNRQERIGALGNALKSDTEANLAQEEEKFKENSLEAGKTPEQATFKDLLKQVNPATGKLYTKEEALQTVKMDENTKEKETYINDQMKAVNPTTGKPFTREEATSAYYQMRAGFKPANPKEEALKDFLVKNKLADTPENRDFARNEMVKRETTTKAEAALPTAEHKIRLQSELAEANQALNQAQADALSRGQKADEFQQKEDGRHRARVTQIDAAQNALNSSDTNELAANIVPLVAVMTTSNEQGIKRLNQHELDRYLPGKSGSFKRWAETNVDKFATGDIPTEYKADVRELLNNMAKEEDQQYTSAKESIDKTIRQGAVTPKVNPKSGRANSTEPSKPAAEKPSVPEGVPTGATHVYRDKNNKVVGYALDGKYHPLGK